MEVLSQSDADDFENFFLRERLVSNRKDALYTKNLVHCRLQREWQPKILQRKRFPFPWWKPTLNQCWLVFSLKPLIDCISKGILDRPVTTGYSRHYPKFCAQKNFFLTYNRNKNLFRLRTDCPPQSLKSGSETCRTYIQKEMWAVFTCDASSIFAVSRGWKISKRRSFCSEPTVAPCLAVSRQGRPLHWLGYISRLSECHLPCVVNWSRVLKMLADPSFVAECCGKRSARFSLSA